MTIVRSKAKQKNNGRKAALLTSTTCILRLNAKLRLFEPLAFYHSEDIEYCDRD